PSESNRATPRVDDRLLVNQLAPRFGPPGRGDIVTFVAPDHSLSAAEPSQYTPNPVLEFIGLAPSDSRNQLIKRVIGVGGDTVACCDGQGHLKVNGEAIDETYLDPGTALSEVEFDVTAPEGHYSATGDKRSTSAAA